MLVGERVRRRLRPLADGPAAQSPDGCDHDGGFTLVEVVITVALMSIAFVAILGSLGTLIASGSTHRAITTAEMTIRDLAEVVKSESVVTYVDCGSNPAASYLADSLNPAKYSPPPGFVGWVVGVRYWDGTAAGNFGATCPTGGDQGAQMVTIRVEGSWGGRSTTQDLDVVKRKP